MAADDSSRANDPRLLTTKDIVRVGNLAKGKLLKSKLIYQGNMSPLGIFYIALI